MPLEVFQHSGRDAPLPFPYKIGGNPNNYGGVRSSEAIGLSTPERPLAILTCMRYTDGARNDTHPGFQLCKNHVAFANKKTPHRSRFCVVTLVSINSGSDGK